MEQVEEAFIALGYNKKYIFMILVYVIVKNALSLTIIIEDAISVWGVVDL